MKLTFIATMVVYSAACVAAPPPHKVESRRDASRPWNSYKAYTVDRIPGFTPSPDPALDEYGGWLGTNVGNPDGFFRVRKINGRWWMVDPAGNLFLAKTMAGFKPGAGGSERQKAALKDRFGDVDGWVASEVAFLKSCGFNSLGSWSEHKAYGKPGKPGRIPYTVIVSPMAAHNRSMKKAERGIFYQNFVNELIKGGTCVGWHWFKYGDNDPTDPLNDPSNRDSNKGLVTWDYRHYEPLADRMREINNCTYNLSRFHEKFSRISNGGRDL